jgi:hypothetical protein
MSKDLTPLEVCERLIAPVEDIGPIVGYSLKAAYNWRRPSKFRRAGDLPGVVQRKLLDHARARGILLKPEWLIEGADADEISAALEGAEERAA